MKRLLFLPLVIFVFSQARAERMAFSYALDFDNVAPTTTLRPTPLISSTIAPTTAPNVRPGVGRPTITVFPPQPQEPAPTPRPQTPMSRADGLLPGMLDPSARPINDSQRSPVWKPFIKRFNQCAPGCQPIRYNAWRRGDPRCHGSGHAIDMFGMKCIENGRAVNHMAIESSKNSGRIADLTVCMTGNFSGRRNLRVKNGLGCLWHNGPGKTSGHHDHVHFSIGCGGGTW